MADTGAAGGVGEAVADEAMVPADTADKSNIAQLRTFGVTS
jgi:hypothetical protein